MKRIVVQKGFAVIAAIFLIIVLGGLGLFMVAFTNNQQITSAQDLQGTRAYWAARAGLEWGISKVVASASAPTCPASPTTLSKSFEGGFTVNVYCRRTPYTEAGSTRHLFQLTSTASSSASVGNIGYAERSVSAGYELVTTP